MKFQILSDLHLEFYGDKYLKRIDSLPVAADILVLAGDIHVGPRIIPTLERFKSRWKNIIYVAGNHEYYNSTVTDISVLRDRAILMDNIYLLENTECTLGSNKVAGCTMWFPDTGGLYKKHMTDFQVIRDFDPWVYKRNAESVDFLTNCTADVIVTHHLPHTQCVDAKYMGHPLNIYFVCDMSKKFESPTAPKLWVHGHTHESIDKMINKTRVVCNPYGYWPNDLNPNFNPSFVVDI